MRAEKEEFGNDSLYIQKYIYIYKFNNKKLIFYYYFKIYFVN